MCYLYVDYRVNEEFHLARPSVRDNYIKKIERLEEIGSEQIIEKIIYAINDCAIVFKAGNCE